MSIIEAEIEPHQMPLAIRVRLAGPRDIEDLTDLLDSGENGREQVLTWLETPGTTLLVAQSELGVLAVAVLMTRLVPLEGGSVHKVIEVDNLVVRADQRGRRVGRRLLAAPCGDERRRRDTEPTTECQAWPLSPKREPAGNARALALCWRWPARSSV